LVKHKHIFHNPNKKPPVPKNMIVRPWKAEFLGKEDGGQKPAAPAENLSKHFIDHPFFHFQCKHPIYIGSDLIICCKLFN
jgi:hypothetical protein